MKTSEKKLIFTEIILIFLLLLNIVFEFKFAEYLITAVFSITSLYMMFSVGFEKNKNIERKRITIYTLFLTIGYLIIIYFLGLFVGFLQSPYSVKIIFSTVFPIIILILSSEFLRYLICRKGERKRIIVYLTVVLFVLADISIAVFFYDTASKSDLIKMITLSVLPSIFKNSMLSHFACKYGLGQNIVYRLITELYAYFMPIVPNLGMYLDSVFMILFPCVIKYLLSYYFDSKKTKVYVRPSKFSKFFLIIISCFMFITIALHSNIFRFWIATIGSGSMTPTIDIGDMVIIDKYYQKHVNKLKEQDIIAFKIENSIYVHRIIEIKEENGKYSIKTKGDRKGNAIDNWNVKNENIIGKVKLKIKYIGSLGVWLNRLVANNNG